MVRGGSCLFARNNHHIDVGDAMLMIGSNVETRNPVDLIRLTQGGGNETFHHLNGLTRSIDTRESHGVSCSLAREGHGTNFLTPTVDNFIRHRSSLLIDNHRVAQRTRELYDNAYDFSSWAGRRIKDDHGDGAMAGTSGSDRSTRINCRGDRL